jgi:hypothetical protein
LYVADIGEQRPCDGGEVTLENVASFMVPADVRDERGSSGTIITGTDVCPTAAWCSSARTAGCSRLATEGSVAQAAFGVDPVRHKADERQGEAVGFAADGSGYFTIAKAPTPPFTTSSRTRRSNLRQFATYSEAN